MESAFRRLPVPLHHFVLQGLVAENGRVGGIPSLLIEDLQFLAAFCSQEVDFSLGIGVKKAFANGAAMGISKRKKCEQE